MHRGMNDSWPRQLRWRWAKLTHSRWENLPQLRHWQISLLDAVLTAPVALGELLESLRLRLVGLPMASNRSPHRVHSLKKSRLRSTVDSARSRTGEKLWPCSGSEKLPAVSRR